MVKIGLIADTGSAHYVDFDKKRIIQENKLTGQFDQTIFDNVKEIPKRKNEGKLYNYGRGGWFASGTSFGQLTTEVRILFDPDKNRTQSGPHFNIQGIVNVSGTKPYQIPVGSAHRIYTSKLKIIFFNINETISGTKVINGIT